MWSSAAAWLNRQTPKILLGHKTARSDFRIEQAREEEPLKPSRLCYFSPVQCLLHFSKEKIAEAVKNDEFRRHGMEKRASASAAIFHIKHAHKHRIRRARQRAQAASMLTMQLGMQWTFDT
ncbi:hypothetical protein Tcan_06634 [Toxocara canis]|uniref:Uncharacterized protein n=1 Tax=Toxocara canis TaxID=6265 RepID=A0A0B2UXG8_TOXCA|nr:hypothetical protein Tcan_06634 [Toxocara canis]